MAEFAAVLGIVNTALPILVKGIQFVQELFAGQEGKGADKKALVMNFAEIGMKGADAVLGKSGTWEIMAPHMDKIIDEVVAAVKEYNAAQKPQAAAS